MDQKLIANVNTIASFLQLGVGLAQSVGMPVRQFFSFLSQKATESGDTEQLKKDLEDWIQMRADHLAESNRPLPLD